MASIDFPNSPTNGQIFSSGGKSWKYNSTKGIWQSVASTTTKNLTALDESIIPSANVTYDLGSSTNAFRDLYLSGNSIFLGAGEITSFSNGSVTLPEGSQVGGVTIGTGSGGATVYANTSLLPKVELTAGEFAFVGNTLFITNGSGWYSVGVVNQSPSLTLSTSSITLGADGNTIDFTFTATDPDGPEPTVSISNSGIANTSVANINLYTANSTVTVDNFSGDQYNATITLTATDGINQTSASVTLSVSYLSELWDETVLSIGTNSTNSLDNQTFIDRSTNAWGSAVNTWGTSFSQTAFHPYLDNWSVEFDGSGDYLTLGSAVSFGTGDFTLEGWVYFKDDTTDMTIFGGNGVGAMDFRRITDGSLRLGRISVAWYTYTGALSLANAWHHIAVVRSSGTCSIYVDGVSQSVTGASNTQNFIDLTYIARNSSAAAYYANAYFSNMRISNISRYSTNFTPSAESLSSDSDTLYLLCQSNQYIDNGPNAETVTRTGDAKISAFNPFGQGSEYNVGANKGSVSFTTTDGIDLKVRSSGTASTWTIEFWYKIDPTSSINANHYLFDARGTAGSQTAGSLYLYRTNTTNYSDGGNWGITDANFNDSAWHWFTMVSDGTNRAIWIDGTRIAELGGTRTVGTHLWINSRESNQYHNDCEFSDFRFSSTARYATSSTTISVPTSPVGTDGNTTAYYPFDNAGIFDKTGLNTLTLFGDVSTSTTQTKHADTAIYFGGVAQTDYIRSNKLFGEYISAATTEIFTIEAWINLEQNNAYPTYQWHNAAIFACSPGYFVFGVDVNNKIVFYHNDGSQRNWTPGSNTISLNTWHHVALCSDGAGGLKTFVDGIQDATGTYYGLQSASATATVELGVSGFSNSNERAFQGYIENFQLLKGVAKYTSNFTPPNRTQGRTYQAES